MMVWSQWQCTKWTSGRAFFGMMVWLQWQCIKWPQLKNFSSSFFWNRINLGKNSHSSEKQLQQNFDHIRVWLITTKKKKFEPDNFIDLATYYKTKPKNHLQLQELQLSSGVHIQQHDEVLFSSPDVFQQDHSHCLYFLINTVPLPRSSLFHTQYIAPYARNELHQLIIVSFKS